LPLGFSASAGDVRLLENSTLLIDCDEAEDIAVGFDLESGDILINGSAPASGPLPAAGVKRIEIMGGDGPNRIDLSQLDPRVFKGLPILTVTAPIVVDAGGGDDVITGSVYLDEIRGGAGDDEIIWRAGGQGDHIDGQDGNDLLRLGGADASEVFVVSLSGEGKLKIALLVPSTVNFTLDGFERLHIDAGGGRDEIDFRQVEGSGLTAAVLEGGDGDDTFTIGRGAQLLEDLAAHGGDGIDTLNYGVYGFSGVLVNLGEPMATALESLSGIENVTGSEGDDVLIGDDGDNVLKGGPGDDALFGGPGEDRLDGGAGSDFYDGGDGTDIADFSSSSAGVKLTLSAAGQGKAKGANVDTFVDMEGVIGSRFNDVIKSSLSNVALWGGDGDDKIIALKGFNTIDGGPGRDVIKTGAGNDTVHGGDGDDIIVDLGGDNLLDGGAGNDRIVQKKGKAVIVGGPGNDVIVGPAEGAELHGDDGDDSITGGKGDDRIFGGSGNDVLKGGSGNDAILGEDGDDSLRGDKGGDTLIGGPGIDAIRDDADDVEVDPGPEP
jgi:Ca2+-binding RTX toxin-like protein